MTTLLQRIEGRQFTGGGQILKKLLAGLVYVFGWLVGKIWWLIKFIVSSFLTGFEDGAKWGNA